MAEVKIGPFSVGGRNPPVVIAEVGINHNGDVEQACRMIAVAREAGCDAVKFQTFKAAEFVVDAEATYTYKSQGKEVTESQLTMFRRYELSRDDFVRIKQVCVEQGMLFLSTPQNYSDLDLLLGVGIEAIKVGSDDFINIPLLKSYATTGLPLILSCGMADLAEIHRSLDAVGAFDGYPVILLYCISLYPTPAEAVNLNKLLALQRTFPTLPIGFSDHSQGPLASSLATALGACLLEKHFTLDHNLPGPDHWFSEDPDGLKQWVTGIRQANAMMGSGLLRPTTSENEMRGICRRSLVVLRDVREGEELTPDNIGLRRPGSGLPAELLETVLGRRALRPLARHDLLALGDFR